MEKYGFHGASHQLYRGAGGGDAGAAGQAGELPPGRQFVDVRHRRRPECGHHDGILAAIGTGERHAARRSGRLRRALHDGASRLERGRSAAATGHGRRPGGTLGSAGRRRARSGGSGHGARRSGAGRLRVPGEEDDRRLCGGDGRDRGAGVHRRDRREFGAAAREVLQRSGVPGDRTGSRKELGRRRPGRIGRRLAGDGAGAEYERGTDCRAARVPVPEGYERPTAPLRAR